jgi:hypothetical protein
MHGGTPGSGGPKGQHNGNYKHGRYTPRRIASRRWLRQLTRDVRVLTKRRVSETDGVGNGNEPQRASLLVAGIGPIPRATIPPWNFDACGVEQEPVNATIALPSTATLSREM